jgi:hypothetical protein
MTPSKFAKTLFAGLAVVALTAGAASAGPRWNQHHPRRTEVNARLANQNRRINAEYREGDLTRAQAANLHAEDRGIRAQERFDASRDGGHITRGEQRQLNHELNATSGQIGR